MPKTRMATVQQTIRWAHTSHAIKAHCGYGITLKVLPTLHPHSMACVELGYEHLTWLAAAMVGTL